MQKSASNKQLVWKRGEGWIQFNPPRSHPSYEEWQELKRKHQEKLKDTTNEK